MGPNSRTRRMDRLGPMKCVPVAPRPNSNLTSSPPCHRSPFNGHSAPTSVDEVPIWLFGVQAAPSRTRHHGMTEIPSVSPPLPDTHLGYLRTACRGALPPIVPPAGGMRTRHAQHVFPAGSFPCPTHLHHHPSSTLTGTPASIGATSRPWSTMVHKQRSE